MSAAAAPARPPSPSRHARVRADILAASAAAFRERGFHGAGMREIAAAVGMTQGNLYHYFPRGKADLLHECQATALRTLLEGARRVARSGAPAPERLREVVRLHVRCLLVETGGSAAHLEFRALPAGRRAAIAAGRRAYERAVRGIVEAGVASGELARVDPKLATLALLGALNATVAWWRPDGDRSPEEIAASYARTLVGGLVP